MAGFGDLEGIIANTRFAPIDVPIIGGDHCSHRSIILLLSNPYVEQTSMVALRGHRCRKSISDFPRVLIHRPNAAKAVLCSSVWGIVVRNQGESNTTDFAI
jgi:hypothetical protein